MRLLNFILSHSVFVSLCAVALCFQTTLLLRTSTAHSIYFFIFFAALSGYNFYWMLSKFYFSHNKNAGIFFKQNRSFLLVFLFAVAGLVVSLFFVENIVLFVVPAMLFMLGYSLPVWPFAFAVKLQKAGFFKTTLLAFTWAYVTVVIPAHSFFFDNIPQLAIMLATRFCFMFLLCIIFDSRDAAVDKLHGLHSLATDVSAKKLRTIVYTAFGFYIVSGIVLRLYLGNGAQALAFFVTGIVVWLVYKLSLKTRGYTFYYFFVDGLMLLSAVLTFFASFF